MSKIWVLDTETKGTGAEVVPLEKTLRKQAPSKEPFWVPPKAAPRPPEEPEPREPYRFKVVDVVSRAVLGENLDARATVELLEGIRSVVDVSIFVWAPERESWRLLTLDEQKAIWERRSV